LRHIFNHTTSMEKSKLGKSLNKEQISRETSDAMPVLKEEVQVGKKVVEKARVRLSKKIKQHTESFDVPVTEEQVVIKRVPIKKIVDTIPEGVRYEGDIMIIPVLKEVSVIEKRIMLVEEIHVAKHTVEKTETRQVTLKTEEVTVERTEIITPGNLP
jgi:uncharacterized protein (TIGR02271 family)